MSNCRGHGDERSVFLKAGEFLENASDSDSQVGLCCVELVNLSVLER